MQRIADFPIEEKPRERLMKYSSSSLSNGELLAILLNKGIKGKNVISLSEEILSKYSLRELSLESVQSLAKIKGVGMAKACSIVACFELGRRAACYSKELSPAIICAQDVYNILGQKLRFEKQEHLVCLYLDTRKRLIKQENVFIGTLDYSVIHPREIFANALRESASAIIIVHNHPSGDPKPSQEDIEITKQLLKAGELMGIPLLDHIVIGENNYTSMRKEKLI